MLIVGLVFVAELVAFLPRHVPESLEFLEAAPTWTLYSLDPDKDWGKSPPEKLFHDYRILGKTDVDKTKSAPLLAALRKGIQDSDGTHYRCFNPRLGISATYNGHSIELVICFECAQIQIYCDGHRQWVTVAHSPEEFFDAVCQEAKVPMAAKPK